jgi:predicted DNA-binding transcriptional regulator YafY
MSDTREKRLGSLTQILQQSHDGHTPTQLAARLGVTSKTIQRDLDSLRDRGFHIQSVDGRHWLDEALNLKALRLSHEEALAIYLALRRFIRQISAAPQFFANAFEKVAEVLEDPRLTKQIIESNETLHRARRANEKRDLIWRRLLEGWRTKVPVRLQHAKQHGGEITEHLFEPQLFEPSVWSDGVYVIGWSQTRKERRTFKLDRIQKVTLSTGTFQAPDIMHLDELLDNAWGIWYDTASTLVQLHFSPRVAERVQETLWHAKQSISLQPDGSLLWEAPVASTLEMVSWVRGWGEDVTVVAPASLRKQIADSMRRAAAQYEE